ncbi:hypothetical protein CLOM_g9574, partial [Closterium sp. NIES-68]
LTARVICVEPQLQVLLRLLSHLLRSSCSHSISSSPFTSSCVPLLSNSNNNNSINSRSNFSNSNNSNSNNNNSNSSNSNNSNSSNSNSLNIRVLFFNRQICLTVHRSRQPYLLTEWMFTPGVSSLSFWRSPLVYGRSSPANLHILVVGTQLEQQSFLHACLGAYTVLVRNLSPKEQLGVRSFHSSFTPAETAWNHLKGVYMAKDTITVSKILSQLTKWRVLPS